MTAEPIDRLNINWSLGWNTYNNSIKDPTSRAGYRDPSALLQPNWNMSGGVQYDFLIGRGHHHAPRGLVLSVAYHERLDSHPERLPAKLRAVLQHLQRAGDV